jgi:hypothetical protein
MANSAIKYVSTQYPLSLENNFSWIGQAMTATAGERLSFGDFVKYDVAVGKWYKAQADVYANSRCEGLWTDTTVDDGGVGFVLTEGIVRIDSWEWDDTAVWLSPTVAGTATSTQPSTITEMLQYVGMAISPTTLYFNPSNDIGEILSSNIVATGGEEYIFGEYRVHIFTTSGTFEILSKGIDQEVRFLVVGGAGGGGADLGGGGGAGGFIDSSIMSSSLGLNVYDITVGSGGFGSPYGGFETTGYNGQDSTIVNFGSSTITAYGGGGGGNYGYAGLSGGSSGGSGATNFDSTNPIDGQQGNPGGWDAGGGGGATFVGMSGGGAGGQGKVSDITGEEITYATGGNGGYAGIMFSDGAPNTGNGGSGGDSGPSPTGMGGSGVVIIRYKY